MARVYGGFIDEMQAAGKILSHVDVSVPQSESKFMTNMLEWYSSYVECLDCFSAKILSCMMLIRKSVLYE